MFLPHPPIGRSVRSGGDGCLPGVHHSLPFFSFFSFFFSWLFLWVAGCIRLIDAVEEWNWTGSDWIVKQICEQMDGSEGS